MTKRLTYGEAMELVVEKKPSWMELQGFEPTGERFKTARCPTTLLGKRCRSYRRGYDCGCRYSGRSGHDMGQDHERLWMAKHDGVFRPVCYTWQPYGISEENVEAVEAWCAKNGLEWRLWLDWDYRHFGCDPWHVRQSGGAEPEELMLTVAIFAPWCTPHGFTREEYLKELGEVLKDERFTNIGYGKWPCNNALRRLHSIEFTDDWMVNPQPLSEAG